MFSLTDFLYYYIVDSFGKSQSWLQFDFQLHFDVYINSAQLFHDFQYIERIVPLWMIRNDDLNIS